MTTDRILRWPAVKTVTGLSRVTVWRQIRAGKFPASIRISDHAIGWRASEIEAWVASRQAA